MSTRAVYTFQDDHGSFDIYKHHDGYPSGALQWVAKALGNAANISNFEACEFAAAFVAANKSGHGGVYLSTGWANHGDLEYRYVITCAANTLVVTCYDMPENTLVFSGTLAEWDNFFVECAK